MRVVGIYDELLSRIEGPHPYPCPLGDWILGTAGGTGYT